MVSEKLNFIIALCAILISGASFYATYLQANSAERQVKAMTLPLIQFSHGNYDPKNDLKVIYFTLKNAGIGPAIIKRVQIEYRGAMHNSVQEFFRACCDAELKMYAANKKAALESGSTEDYSGWVSQPLIDIILPGQSNYEFQRVGYGENSHDFWKKLNAERWGTNLNICYCSMLDECFVSERNGVVREVAACN